MNTSALKTFAPAMRRQLMEAVTRKLDYVLNTRTPDLLTTFAPQVAALRRVEQTDRAGLVERVAYTWFNRLAALRFLDARGWHPFRARVLTPAGPEETQPELLKLTRAGTLPAELAPHTQPQRLNDLLDGRIPSPDAQGEVYRHLVLASCRFYHALLPNLFEKLDDESELLLPDDLLTEHSVVQGFRTEISDADCAEVEILGWLYQFYISEKKDAVMARKSAVPTEDIPAVTQLFTPHWIVRYLVENSLGRLWLQNRPQSKLREKMPYYIEDAPQPTPVSSSSPNSDLRAPISDSSSSSPSSISHLPSSPTPGTDFLRISNPTEIRLLDPACGSGHMLTYAFDLLYEIYAEEGHPPSEIPALILRHNLHGLDICPRAAQLAELALVFKAREKSRRFFQTEHLVRPRIIELRDVRFAENELRDYIQALALGGLFNQPVVRLLHQFEEAKNFGSLIQPCLDERSIADVRRAIEAKDLGGQLFLRETNLKVLRVLEQAEALTQRYHVVVANPPYQEQNDMNGQLRVFIDSNYRNGNTDLCCAFMLRNQNLTYPSGFVGMITMQSWMFLVGSSALRDYFTRNAEFDSMLHLGPRAFDSIPGEVVQTTAFVFTSRQPTKRPKFFRLVSGRNEREKEGLFLTGQHRFDQCNLADFRRITASPFAYWASEAVFRAFEGHPAFSDCAAPCQGLSTGDTPRFLRYWHEVSRTNSEFSAASSKAAQDSGKKWFPIDKGGPPRRWFGNNDFIVNWFRDGTEVRNLKTISGKQKSYARNSRFYFDPGVTWTKVSSGPFASRHTGAGFIFSDAGMKVFANNEAELRYIACFLNSRVANYLLGFLSETINYEQGNLARLPLAKVDLNEEVGIALLDIARADWDNFETSWDFRELPILRNSELGTRNAELGPRDGERNAAALSVPGDGMPVALKGRTVAESWANWKAYCDAAIRRMQELETENNRLFIEAYGLQDELTPEVPEDQITLARADVKKDMVALLSYAVGCMMGRYSLAAPGLILANAGDTLKEYHAKLASLQASAAERGTRNAERETDSPNSDLRTPISDSEFLPDEDGILPVLDGEWFEDDVVERTREFLRVTFGEATLRENVRFIEESLGKDLRDYFTTDFFRNHISGERAYGYKKRPIYWMVQSPKKGFQCLIYLHRYTRDTLNQVLNRYLRPYQVKLRSRLAQLDHQQTTAETAKAKTEARKLADKLRKVLLECEEWERQTLLPLAQARIELDLDDGVKVNYQKLGEALAPIPGLATKDED